MRGRPPLVLVVVLLLVGALAVVSTGTESDGLLEERANPISDEESGWQDLGPIPVDQRRDAALAVTSDHIVVIGGRELRRDRQLTPLRDGAILDPESGEWRKTELPFDQPVGQLSATSDGSTVMVIGTACSAVDPDGGLETCSPGDIKTANAL